MCHVFQCDTPARQIANTLRDICKRIMQERGLQAVTAEPRLSRPTDLPNLEKMGQHNSSSMLDSETSHFCSTLRPGSSGWPGRSFGSGPG